MIRYKEKLEAAKREGKLKLKVATPDPISSAAAPGSADDSDADGESADAGAEAESRLKASPDQNPTMKPLGTILKLELLKVRMFSRTAIGEARTCSFAWCISGLVF